MVHQSSEVVRCYIGGRVWKPVLSSSAVLRSNWAKVGQEYYHCTQQSPRCVAPEVFDPGAGFPPGSLLCSSLLFSPHDDSLGRFRSWSVLKFAVGIRLSTDWFARRCSSDRADRLLAFLPPPYRWTNAFVTLECRGVFFSRSQWIANLCGLSAYWGRSTSLRAIWSPRLKCFDDYRPRLRAAYYWLSWNLVKVVLWGVGIVFDFCSPPLLFFLFSKSLEVERSEQKDIDTGTGPSSTRQQYFLDRCRLQDVPAGLLR